MNPKRIEALAASSAPAQVACHLAVCATTYYPSKQDAATPAASFERAGMTGARVSHAIVIDLHG